MGTFGDLMVNEEANRTAAEFVRDKICEIVHDPAVAELLLPKQIIGCKRICIDTDYYETFNRPNVRLVDVKHTPIDEFTPQGIRIGDTEHELDCVVLATGYDAMTGTALRLGLVGRGGRTLADAWSAGPRSYLGLGVPGFPNAFFITGPGSPSVLSAMITAIEQHVEWITACIAYVRRNGYQTIEADAGSADAWVEHVNAVADTTLFPHCNSWYLGANVPGKPRVFMPLIGFPAYVDTCRDVVANDYEGFVLGRGLDGEERDDRDADTAGVSV